MSELLQFFEDLDPFDLLSDTMYPAPAANETIADFSQMQIKEIKAMLSVEELWRISNSFIKRKNYSEALKYVQIALKKDPKQSRLKALKGLCFLFLGDSKKAELEFNSVLKGDEELPEVRIWFSFLKAKQQKWTSLARQLSLVLDKKNSQLHVIKLLLELWQFEASQKKSKYKSVIEELHQYQGNIFCSDVLTLHYFREGRLYIEKGDLMSAARTWLVTFNRDQLSWFRHRVIASTIQLYASDRVYFLQTRKKDTFYGKVLEKLLHVSLLPEFFEEEKDLDDRLSYWKTKITSKGSYPYAHFRYALCLAYRGDIHQAYEEMLTCRDKIPASKVSFFRIDELIDWLRDPEYGEEKTDPWQHFFESEYEIKSWQTAGFNDPRAAKRWKTLDAKPEEAREWETTFSSAPSLAYGYYACGFRDPKVALSWSKHFSVPSDAWECYTREQELKIQHGLLKDSIE